MRRVTRRSLMRAAGALGAGALAGCTGSAGGGTPQSLPPPVAGDPESATTVMVFEDFACPHCRQFALEVFPEIEAEYLEPEQIRYEHHDFPIPVHERWSWQVASAARGVQDTVGDGAFFDYATRLYRNQDRYNLDVIAMLAEAVGANSETIREAAREQTYRPVIETDRELGRDLDLRGTPQIYVNGEPLSGYGYDTVAPAIEQSLA